MTTDINETPDETPDEEEQQLRACDWCTEVYEEEDLTTINRVTSRTPTWRSRVFPQESLCSHCYSEVYTCESCRADVHSDNTMTVDHDTVLCEHCGCDYSWCENCDTYRSNDDHDFDYCGDDSHGRVRSYSYRPDPVFFRFLNGRAFSSTSYESNSTMFTGMELEVETESAPYDQAVELASEIFGDSAYLKHDGSLNNGFEIVTHPMTLDYIRNSDAFNRVAELARIGVRSAQTSTCGLHIHINKSWMRKNPSVQYRFMSLFYNNRDKWQALAGRSNSQYALWSDEERDNMLNYAKGLSKTGWAHDVSNYNRYVAVNLQNSKTIELRFFKGTLKSSTLLARLEGVHAVAMYANESRYRLPMSTVHEWERFREWTVTNKFTAFDAYATSKGI